MARMIETREEKMRSGLVKTHLLGLPFAAVIHRFTEPDNFFPHDHPFSFTSFIMQGGYHERIYTINKNGTYDKHIVIRVKGDVFRVEANTIHEIIELPYGETIKLIQPEKWIQEPGFYEFKDSGVFYRQWDEPEFRKI